MARFQEPGDAIETTSPAPFMAVVGQLRPAVAGLILLTVLTGSLFPMVLYGIAQFAFPSQAAGGLITRNGVVVGSRLIGQPFARPGYFHSRPSAAGTGYDGTSSGGTNLGASNPTLILNIKRTAESYRRENGLRPDAAIPIDAVTSSGSGLDPHISRRNADLQTPRVARARGLGEGAVRALIASNTRNRDLGILGEPRVSVLDLNLALDRATQAKHG